MDAFVWLAIVLFVVQAASLLLYLVKIGLGLNIHFASINKKKISNYSNLQSRKTGELVSKVNQVWENDQGVRVQKWYHNTPGVLPDNGDGQYPLLQNKYFKPLQSTNRKVVCILVPFYNESFDELLDTLESLYQNIQHVNQMKPNEYTFSILLVQDGWKVADCGMKKQLIQLFKNDEAWCDVYKEQTSIHDNETYIFQRVDQSGCLMPTAVPSKLDVYDSRVMMDLNLTLIVKKQNRRKLNTLEWFLSEDGYCGGYNPLYAFTTDCSTIFDKECLWKLIHLLHYEPNCIVSTGKQVVKTVKQQRSKDTTFETCLRAVQGYDFESTFAAFTGAFAEFNFLPLVPGACGLYNYELLKGKALEKYFKLLNRPVHECGIIENNVKLVEDRMLAYFSVFHAKVPVTMGVCPNAEFYSNAETNLPSLVKQRRRWINGGVGSVIYTLQHPELIFCSQLPFFKRIAITLLFLCQLLVYLVMAVSPAIFLCCFYESLFWVFSFSECVPDSGCMENKAKISAIVLVGCYIIYYLGFKFLHVKKVCIGWTFMLHIVLGAITMLLATSGSIYYLIFATEELFSETKCQTEPCSFPLDKAVTVIAISVCYIYALVPLTLTMHNFRSFKRAIMFFLPYFLFLPTFIAWFGVYFMARMADFSWGNRPTPPPSQTRARLYDDRHPDKSLEEQLYEEELNDKREQELMSGVNNIKSMQDNSIACAICFAAVNIALVVVYIVFSESKVFLLCSLLVISVPSLILMTFSITYFLLNYQLEILLRGVMKVLTFISGAGKREYFVPIIADTDDSSEPEATPDASTNSQSSLALLVTNESASRFRVVLVIVLMSSFFLATNLSYQASFLDIGKATEWGPEWFHSVLSATFQLCGFIGLVIGFLGDKYVPKYPGIFMAMTVVGLIISVVPNLVISSLMFTNTFADLDDTQIAQVYYARVICVIIGNNIAAPSAVVIFLRTASASYLLEFIGTRALFGAIGNSIVPLIVMITNLDSNDDKTAELTLAICSSIILVLSFFAMCLGMKLANFTNDDRIVKDPSVNAHTFDRRLRYLAIVFVAFFCLHCCYAPVQFQLPTYAIEIEAPAEAADYSLFLQSSAYSIIGLLTLAFFKNNLKQISVSVTVFSLLPLLFLFPFLGEYWLASFSVISVSAIYRTFTEVFAFYYFAAIIQGQYCRLGTFYGAFNVTLILAQILGNSILFELGSLLGEQLSANSSMGFGFASLLSFVAVASVLKLPIFLSEYTQEKSIV